MAEDLNCELCERLTCAGFLSSWKRYLMMIMSGWYGSAHISNSLTAACACASHRQGTCRPSPKGFVRCSSWSEVPRRSAIIGLGASLAASSISAGTIKLAHAMSGADSMGRTDLDGLSISQVRFLANLPVIAVNLLPNIRAHITSK